MRLRWPDFELLLERGLPRQWPALWPLDAF